MTCPNAGYGFSLLTLFADDDDCISRFIARGCILVTVCGSDGETYPTPCALEFADCEARKKGLAPIKRVDDKECGSPGEKGQGKALLSQLWTSVLRLKHLTFKMNTFF